MRLFVVAWREAHVPSSLAAAGRRIDLDVQVLTPPEAAKAATTDDLVLGYLDVRPTLDGIEPGIAKLRGLGSRGVTVMNEPDALRTQHPWAYDWNTAPAFDASAQAQLIKALRTELAQLGTLHTP